VESLPDVLIQVILQQAIAYVERANQVIDSLQVFFIRAVTLYSFPESSEQHLHENQEQS
jgi:hypothetical protein